MPRSRQSLGPNLQRVLELAPVAATIEFLAGLKGTDGSLVSTSEFPPRTDVDALSTYLSQLDPDILRQLEDQSRRIVDLSDGKGPMSLETVVHQRMSHEEIELFEDQRDELRKSLWTFLHHQSAFEDARSFHSARRHREHGNLYSAFEVAADAIQGTNADDIDLGPLCEHVRDELGLKAKVRATAIDLPGTNSHPASILVVIRHGDALSSVQDHRDDGLRETYYYRPANEAILIYTPALRKLEVCAKRYITRDKVSRAFAELVLGQNLSEKPLTARDFSLERFKTSLFLPLPDLADVDVLSASVTGLELRLGTWKRVLRLQVTPDDDIESFAERYMKDALAAARVYGYSRVTIVATFRRRGAVSDETLSLWVNSNNMSNAQNDRDPQLRDLGIELLQFWGLTEQQRLLGERETPEHFSGLLFLCDHPSDEIEGRELRSAGIDITRLLSAQLISRKSRQQVVLIDDGEEVIEADLETGEKPGQLTVSGPHGEDFGGTEETDHTIYKIARPYLLELVLDALKTELGAPRADIVADQIAEFGAVPIGDHDMPVYLVWCLDAERKPELLDQEFRRRHLAGPGLILTTGETDITYMGANVVVPLKRVVTVQDCGIELNPDALDQAWRSGQSLVLASDTARIIHHGPRFATLHLPGQPPLNLFAKQQAVMFERLIEETRRGRIDVRTGDLMRDMGSASPSQLFSSPLWAVVKDHYMTQARPKSWRLGPADPNT